MALSARTERTFRNTLALSYLLVGFALMAFSMGGILQFVADTSANGLPQGADWAPVLGVLAIIAIYLVAGYLLAKNRPRNWADQPQAPWVAGPALLRAGRLLSIVFLILGGVMAFGGSPYGQDSTVAALLVLGGAFGQVAITLSKRLDVNVRATAGIVGFLAATLILVAQLRFNYQSETAGTYGAWETTALVFPRVFGPVALMIVASGALVYAYARRTRPEYASYVVLTIAALVYGIGVALASLAFFIDTPWSSFLQIEGVSIATLAALTAGDILLIAGAASIIVASIIGLIRNGQIITGATQKTETTTLITPPAGQATSPTTYPHAEPSERVTTSAQRTTPSGTTTIHKTTTTHERHAPPTS